MKVFASCSVVIVTAVLCGCASQPAAPASAVASAVAAPVQPDHPVTIVVKAVGAPVNDPTFQLPFGYKRVVLSNGEERFCRYDLVPNSRTQRSKVCYTEAQLKAHQDSTQSFIDQIQKHGVDATALCTPGTAGRPCPGGQGY